VGCARDGLDPLGLNSAGLPVPHQGTTCAWTSMAQVGATARHVVEGSSRFAKDVRIPKAQGEHCGSKTVKGSTRAAPEIHAEIT